MKHLTIILAILTISLHAQDDCKKYSDNYIPVDLNDAMNYLDCLWSQSDKDIFKNKDEDDAVTEMHFGTGMGIRNSWGLWKGNSEISKYFRDNGIFHPDDMSSIILRSFHRYLNNKEIKIEEQIGYYKSYWEKMKKQENERKKRDLLDYVINDTVEFSYDYDFVSETQENDYMNDSCIAIGIILDMDTIDFKLKVRLIKSCDEKGIIILVSDIHVKEGDNWILKEKNKKEYMFEGDIKWTSYELWDTR